MASDKWNVLLEKNKMLVLFRCLSNVTCMIPVVCGVCSRANTTVTDSPFQISKDDAKAEVDSVSR